MSPVRYPLVFLSGVVSAKGTRLEVGADLDNIQELIDWQDSSFNIAVGVNTRALRSGFMARTDGNIVMSGSYRVLESALPTATDMPSRSSARSPIVSVI